MNEENKDEVIKKNDEQENKNNDLKTILTFILVPFIIATSIITMGVLFIVYFILWLVLRKKANKDKVWLSAFCKSFKIVGIIFLVILCSVGTCFVVFFCNWVPEETN